MEKRTDLLNAEIAKLEKVVADLEARNNRRISVRMKKRFKRVWRKVAQIGRSEQPADGEQGPSSAIV